MSRVIEFSGSNETYTLDEDADGFDLFHQVGDFTPVHIPFSDDEARLLAISILHRLERVAHNA